MAKQDIIKAVHEVVGDRVNQKVIEKILDATFTAISGLEEEQSCRIKDFGTFKVKRRAARKITLPNAPKGKAKPVEVPSRLAMTFKMSSKFKEALNAEAPKAKKTAKKAAKKKAPAKKKAAKKKK